MEQGNALAYQDLHPDDIMDAIESVGFRTDGRLLALNSYENRVYQVGIESDVGASTIVAKFYRPGRWTDAAILEEHEFCAELAAEEIPVVTPLAHEGTTLHHGDEFRFAVFPCRGGRAPELDNLDLLLQLGRLVARIHNRGELAEFEHRPLLSIETFGIDSRDYLLGAGFIPAELKPAYESICADLLVNIEACYERAGSIRNLRLHCTAIFTRATCWCSMTRSTSWISMTRAWARRCRICGCFCRANAMNRRRN